MAPKEKIELEMPASAESLAQEGFVDRERMNFPDSWIVVAKHKRFILSFVGSVAVLSAIISLLLPKSYTATAKMLPPQPSQSIASAMLSQLGGLAPLLGVASGRDFGLRNPNDLYISMLRSRTVADDLVDRFNLMSVYHQKLRGGARKRLETLTDIKAAKDGIISISVDDRDASRAAAIANAYITELENLTQTLAVTDASKRRAFFEREAKSASDELAKAELALKQTEETTGIVSLDNQARFMLQAYAELRAQAAAKEVQVRAMRSFATPKNPDLKRAEEELAGLREQIDRYESGQGGRPVGDIALEKVPAKALEYIRKFREVKYREALMELMLKQYEVARIDESKEAAVIQVLDRAITPEKRSWPPRTALVLASTLLATVVALAWVFLLEKFERAREDPQFLAQFQLFRFYLRGRA